MTKQNKMLIGVGVAGLAAYYFYTTMGKKKGFATLGGGAVPRARCKCGHVGTITVNGEQAYDCCFYGWSYATAGENIGCSNSKFVTCGKGDTGGTIQ